MSPRTDVGPAGIVVGHATDGSGGTGLTVIRSANGEHYRGGVAIVGRASGTREIHTLDPDHLADRVDAIVLTGGSAYGLDAVAGVMRWMEERGQGVAIGGGVVPIVPAAVIFDLAPIGRFDARPTARMAYDACEHASASAVEEGSIGAGTGATVGKGFGRVHAMKGGVGVGVTSAGDVHVSAIAVVNAVGDVRDGDGRIIAGARIAHRFVDTARAFAAGTPVSGERRPAEPAMRNTTIACVATNAALSRVELRQVARASTAALYKRITPAGTSADGDVVFAIGPAEGVSAGVAQVEALAVLALEDAIERAVRFAVGRDGIPGLADIDGH